MIPIVKADGTVELNLNPTGKTKRRSGPPGNRGRGSNHRIVSGKREIRL